jgi:hypothetical protein
MVAQKTQIIVQPIQDVELMEIVFDLVLVQGMDKYDAQ